MEERRQELAEALTREEGKTIAESRGEIQRAINVVEFFAGEARRITGETIPSELPNNFCYTVKQPMGPVGIITPWNFPVAIPIWKMAPALVSGNTVVFKPATLTPLTATLIVEIFDECGVPPGVLNLVYGGGREVGDTIVRHPAIQARVVHRLERRRHRPLQRRGRARHQVPVRDGRQEPDRHPRATPISIWPSRARSRERSARRDSAARRRAARSSSNRSPTSSSSGSRRARRRSSSGTA